MLRKPRELSRHPHNIGKTKRCTGICIPKTAPCPFPKTHQIPSQTLAFLTQPSFGAVFVRIFAPDIFDLMEQLGSHANGCAGRDSPFPIERVRVKQILLRGDSRQAKCPGRVKSEPFLNDGGEVGKSFDGWVARW